MRDCDHRLYFTLALAGMLLLTPQSACAYIDAATGSYALQMLFGAFFTALFWVKSLLGRLKNRGDYAEIEPSLKSTGS